MVMGSLAIGIFAFIFVVWIMPVIVKKFAPEAPDLGGSIGGLGAGLSDFFKGLFEPITLGIGSLKDLSTLDFRPTFKPTIGYSLDIEKTTTKEIVKDVEIECPDGFEAKKNVLGVWSCEQIKQEGQCPTLQKWCESQKRCIGITAKCKDVSSTTSTTTTEETSTATPTPTEERVFQYAYLELEPPAPELGHRVGAQRSAAAHNKHAGTYSHVNGILVYNY